MNLSFFVSVSLISDPMTKVRIDFVDCRDSAVAMLLFEFCEFCKILIPIRSKGIPLKTNGI